MSDVEIRTGQVWRHKRDPFREVEIEGVSARGDLVYVRRNTSRRRQGIMPRTLRRDYRLHAEAE